MKVSVEFRSGWEGRAAEWSLYLPGESQSIKLFPEPVTIVLQKDEELRRATMRMGEKGAPLEGHWIEDPSAVGEAFARVWPSVLQSISQISGDDVQLVYFAGQATDNELFSLWPYLPFEFGDTRLLFVSEMRKDSRKRAPALGRVRVEYSPESFKRLADPDAFSYAYGMVVMGVSVAETQAASHLARDVFDKETLEESLKDEGLRCWWFCDADFEGLTVWHKDYPDAELARRLAAGWAGEGDGQCGTEA